MEQHSLNHQVTLPVTSPTMESTEDHVAADVDEPPEHRAHWIHSQLPTTFGKANSALLNRRESLLTRQLHSEAEQSTDDEVSHAPPRALSTQSTWSNPSVASTAELTSDDGHSVASPAISPPLPPTAIRNAIPITEKPLAREPQIVGPEEKIVEPGSEQSVEAGLGRKRCISFACGNKTKPPPTSEPAPSAPAKEEQQTPASPPKRKCTIKFACPAKPVVETKITEQPPTSARRHMSPPPPERRSSARAEAVKPHRGSDSTVTHASPKSIKKIPAVLTTAATPTTPIADPFSRRRMSNGSNSSTEATRFHEFASSEDEPEEWVQESGCHRSRLTVNDTLKKENILRKACEEVEEEAVDEEDEDDEIEEDNGDEDDEDDNEVDDGDELDEDDEESDDGFRTDDEEGFAESDSEGEEDWWRPGGRSTAATSIEHMDRLAISQKDDVDPASSAGSASSGRVSPKGLRSKPHRRRMSQAITIGNRSDTLDLPDSTDFVCGTLDEDRPLEQAYLNQLKQKEAAKHKVRPQDIDPTFPTSDPEMDEEDEEDLVDPEESEVEDLVHGELDELDDEPQTLRASTRPRARSNANKSPAPATRRRSPAPPALLKRQSTLRSPPPPVRRSTARSPPPRKLFGHSPHRSKSPAHSKPMPSPPNTRRVSPWASSALDVGGVLAGRPQLTHTASLPRGGFLLGKINELRNGDSPTAGDHAAGDIPKRGAIDIYKGLEKKRQRRKEKLYQKLCAKAAAKGEKIYKVKPGRGAERMREVGLELQRYHGKGEHILSM